MVKNKYMKYINVIIATYAILSLSHFNAFAMSNFNYNQISFSEFNGEVKTIECPGHSWNYITITSGSIVYYNYQCANCNVLRYDTWKKSNRCVNYVVPFSASIEK